MSRRIRTGDRAAEGASKNRKWAEEGFRRVRTLEKGGTAQLVRERNEAKSLTGGLVAQIRAHRRKHGITQAEVARRMGAPASVVARLEREPHNCTMSTLLRYAEAAGVTLTVTPHGTKARRAG